jgi:hypothetical protein
MSLICWCRVPAVHDRAQANSATDRVDEVKAMLANGLGTLAFARELGIGRRSVYRIAEAG